MIPLIGCETVAFKAITPEIIEYEREVQLRAADELDTLGPPCPRDAVFGGCSAIKRMIKDYLLTRDRIRVLNEDKEEPTPP